VKRLRIILHGKINNLTFRHCHARRRDRIANLDASVKSRKPPFSSFRRKPESSKFKNFWIPDQIRYDGFGTFYDNANLETIKIQICCHIFLSAPMFSIKYTVTGIRPEFVTGIRPEFVTGIPIRISITFSSPFSARCHKIPIGLF